MKVKDFNYFVKVHIFNMLPFTTFEVANIICQELHTRVNIKFNKNYKIY